MPVVDQITSIISGITELAKTIEIHNTLTVHTPEADGTATIDQQVTDVGFKLLNQSTVVAFDANEKMAAHTRDAGHRQGARQRAGRRRRPRRSAAAR